MKKALFKTISISLILINIFTISVFAGKEPELSWFIKRNGNGRPNFSSDAENLSALNAYYIDDTLEDGEKRIYLTFDAGYENGNVEKILDAMKAEGVLGAFFLLDNIILKNTELVKRMSEEGHFVCNHTKRHRNLCSASPEEIATDLTSLELLYLDKTGDHMKKYFRFPEGKYSKSALEAVNELGYKTIFWSFAYEDWDNSHQMSEEKAINKIMSNTHNGAVMLFHPTSSTNAKIFPTLIKKWKAQGYTFGTLDELTQG